MDHDFDPYDRIEQLEEVVDRLANALNTHAQFIAATSHQVVTLTNIVLEMRLEQSNRAAHEFETLVNTSLRPNETE